MQRGSPEKKIPAQAVSEKKNSCKLKIPPPPPITFLMVRPEKNNIPSVYFFGSEIFSWITISRLQARVISLKAAIRNPLGQRRLWEAGGGWGEGKFGRIE